MLGIGRWGWIYEIADEKHTIGRKSSLDKVIADAFGIADPGMGMTVGLQLVIAPKPRNMYGPSMRREMREAGGPAHVGLDYIRRNIFNGLRNLMAC
jgi:hypothetical protein